MKRSFAFILIFLASSFAYSQIGSDLESRDRKRKNGKLWSKNRRDAIYSHSNSNYRPFGWFINPGATYMIGNSAQDPDDGSYNLTPSGLPGYYVEGGLAFLMKRANKAVHYFDIALGVKHFGGTEKYKSDVITERGHFNFGSAFFRGGIHNCWQLNMYNFIDQSLGVNFDYRIYGGKGDDSYGFGLDPNTNKMSLQLHYSFGWGIKIRDGFFIIPTVQTPVVSFLPWDGANPGLQWFSSKYQPTILTLKFGWLFPKKGCNVPNDPRQKDANDRFEMQ